TLAMRRGAMLDAHAVVALSAAPRGALDKHGLAADKMTAEERCDADALVAAKLLKEADGVLCCEVDTAEQLIGRGAVLAVSSAIAGCGGASVGGPLVLSREAAQSEVATAQERAQSAQAEAEVLATRAADAARTIEALKRDNETMREWFRSANLP